MLKGRQGSSRACSGSLLDASSHQALSLLIAFLATLPRTGTRLMEFYQKKSRERGAPSEEALGDDTAEGDELTAA